MKNTLISSIRDTEKKFVNFFTKKISKQELSKIKHGGEKDWKIKNKNKKLWDKSSG